MVAQFKPRRCGTLTGRPVLVSDFRCRMLRQNLRAAAIHRGGTNLRHLRIWAKRVLPIVRHPKHRSPSPPAGRKARDRTEADEIHALTFVRINQRVQTQKLDEKPVGAPTERGADCNPKASLHITRHVCTPQVRHHCQASTQRLDVLLTFVYPILVRLFVATLESAPGLIWKHCGNTVPAR